MKKFITLASFYTIHFFIGSPCQAQQIPERTKPNQNIDLNFLNPTSVYYWKLKDGTPYRVRLLNVNKLIYKSTTAEQTGENLFSTIPTALSAVKLPGFANKNLPVTDKGNAPGAGQANCDCSAAAARIKCDIELNRLYNTFVNQLSQTGKDIDTFNSHVLLGEELQTLQENVVDSFGIIRKKKMQFVTDAIHISVAENDTSLEIAKFYKRKHDEIEQLLSSAGNSLDSISKALDEVSEHCFAKDTLNLSRTLRCLDPCKDKYSFWKYKDSLSGRQSMIKSYTKLKESLKSDLDEAKASFKEIETALKEGKIALVQKMYNVLNEENFTLTVETFEATKDLHTVKFTATAENALPFNRPQKRTVILNGITTGGWKVDFSTGAFINLGSEEFLGPSYYYTTVSDTTKQIQQITGRKSAMLSIGALMHIYPRLYSFIKPGLSFGVSTTTGFESLNFHTGISFLFGTPGKRSRVVLTGGLTLREVNLLDPRYQLNTAYKGLPDAIPTSSFFPKTGGFLSLTYNFASASK